MSVGPVWRRTCLHESCMIKAYRRSAHRMVSCRRQLSPQLCPVCILRVSGQARFMEWAAPSGSGNVAASSHPPSLSFSLSTGHHGTRSCPAGAPMPPRRTTFSTTFARRPLGRIGRLSPRVSRLASVAAAGGPWQLAHDQRTPSSPSSTLSVFKNNGYWVSGTGKLFHPVSRGLRLCDLMSKRAHSTRARVPSFRGCRQTTTSLVAGLRTGPMATPGLL